MLLAPGDTVAGYTVVRELGSGGMGAVYLARHPRLPRLDALKLLRRELCDDPDFAQRFLREADVVAGLSHRNIVPVLDRGEDNGQLWLTMQYVDGIDAETALTAAGGLLPAERAVHIVTEVAAALDAAHRQHLVHRDVKPANILLRSAPDADDEPEQVFLTDFGIAKPLEGTTHLTRTGVVVATFDYASPEQIDSRPLDARSDVYSLGCVLHKLLTGHVPFPGDTMLAALHGHLSLPPPHPTELVPWLPPGLDGVVARAMAKDPAERFPTCRALAAAAAAALPGLPAAPEPPYVVTLSREAGTAVGPTGTDRLPPEVTHRLGDLIRRTRFFDLPDVVPPPAESSESQGIAPGATLEIATATRHRRVAMDLRSQRLPPAFDELVAAVGALAAATPIPAPSTVAGPAPSPPAAHTEPEPPAPASSSLPTTRLPTPPPSAPPQPAPSGRRGRGPWIVLAVVVAVLLAGGGTWFLLGHDDGTGSRAAGSAGAPAGRPPAQAALDALPRGAPLPATTLVVPRQLDGNIDLYLVDATSGATARRLTSAPGDDVGPLIAPDRRTVVYAHASAGGAQLRAVASDGSGDRPLFATDIGCPNPGRPAWNPVDPSRLALTCTGGVGSSLRLVTLDGATVRSLAPGIAVVDDLCFSPDGTRLGFWGAPDTGTNGGSLFVLPADGSAGPSRVTDSPDDADPTWSPDGQRLAFRRVVAPGQSHIFAIAPDGSGLQQLTSAGGIDQDPIWSPDGAMIAFKSSRPGPAATTGDHVWVMSSDGSGQRQLDDRGGTATNAPAWGNR